MKPESSQEEEEERNRAVYEYPESRTTLKSPADTHWKASTNVGTAAKTARNL